MNWIPQNETGYAIGWTVVHSLWQGMLLAAIAGGLILAGKHKSPSAKSTILLVAMALMPVISMITYFLVYPETYVDPSILKGTALEGLPSPPGTRKLAFNPGESVATTLSINDFIIYINRHLYLIITIWMVGVGLSLLRLLSGISYVSYLRHNYTVSIDQYWHTLLNDVQKKIGLTNKNIDILESALVKTPMVIGQLKPLILLPIGMLNQMSDKQVEAILAHELAHVLRKDYLFNFIQNIIESIYYFHPAIWWLSSQLRNEREKCCDDIAIKACDDKISYIKALVSVQEMALTPSRLSLAFTGQKKSSIFARVNRLIQPESEILTIQEKLYASGFIVLLALLFQFQSFSDVSPEGTVTQKISYYLKYDRYDGLDSLLLDFSVADGIYRREDDFQEVVLEVISNKVINFTINGLDIDGEDMDRFKKLIEFVIIQDSVGVSDFNEIITENIHQDKIVLTDKAGNLVELYNSELGRNMLKIIHPDQTTEEFKLIEKTLYKNGVVCKENELLKYGWKISDVGFEAIIHAEPQSEVKKEKEIPKIISINSADTVTTSICQNDVFQEWASLYLITNNFIKINENYSYMLSFDRLVVNGKTTSEEIRNHWQMKYEELYNKKFDASTYVTGNFTF